MYRRSKRTMSNLFELFALSPSRDKASSENSEDRKKSYPAYCLFTLGLMFILSLEVIILTIVWAISFLYLSASWSKSTEFHLLILWWWIPTIVVYSVVYAIIAKSIRKKE